MSDRNDEKNRLWNEVFSKKRTYEEKDDSNIELTIEAPKKEAAPSTTDTILKTADKAMQELNRILTKQKEDLQQMQEQLNKKEPARAQTQRDIDLETLEKQLKDDYGIEPAKEVIKEFDQGKVFQEIETEVSQKIIGQDEAVKKVCVAFRRPFVMGENENGIKNVMLMAMFAWVLRFGLFGAGNPGMPGVILFVLSCIVYGFAFDFFNISGGMYVDQEVNVAERSSAQGLFMMMTNGLGATIGTLSAQAIVNHFVYAESVQAAGAMSVWQGWQTAWYIFAAFALVVCTNAFRLCVCFFFRNFVR